VLSGERLERLGDLAGVPEVFVDVDGHKGGRRPEGEVRRRASPPFVDVLAVVHEGVNLAVRGVRGAGEQRLPPQRGEVLCFIDDDGVQALVRFHFGGQFL
jgi:hypothetical protein